MRLDSQLAGRERGAPAGRRTDREHRHRKLCPVPAARRHSGRDAVELSVLAGVSRRPARADRRQRDAAQALLQRAAVCAGDRGGLSRSGGAGGRFPNAAHRVGRGRPADRRPPRRRGHPDRLRQGRRYGGGVGRQGAEEDCARAGRFGPFHRARRRGPRCRLGGRRPRAQPEQRSELHRGQALHRRGAGRGRVRAAFHRGRRRAEGRQPDGPRQPGGSACARRPGGRARATGQRIGAPRGARADGRQADRRRRLLLRAHRPVEREAGHARVPRGDVRAGGGCDQGQGRRGRPSGRQRYGLRARLQHLDA